MLHSSTHLPISQTLPNSESTMSNKKIYSFRYNISLFDIDTHGKRIFFHRAGGIFMDSYNHPDKLKLVNDDNSYVNIRIYGSYLYMLVKGDIPIRKVGIYEGEICPNAVQRYEPFGHPGVYLANDFCIDSIGNIYILTGTYILKFGKSIGGCTTFAGTPYVYGYENGTHMRAKFTNPTRMAIYNDCLYIAEPQNRTIRVIDTKNSPIEVTSMYPLILVAGRWIEERNIFKHIVIDYKGNMFIGTDSYILKVDIATRKSRLYSKAAQGEVIEGIVVGKDNHIYIAAWNSQIMATNIYRIELWSSIRLIMLAYMGKEDSQSCSLSLLPRDILRIIINLVNE